jgi:1-acyl-sn-glycerol-3-phosphate acyltransferase
MTDRAKTPAPVLLYRATLLLLHLFAGILTVAALFPIFGKTRRRRAIRRWSARVLSILNIELRVQGAPALIVDRRAVLVANHVSWLDIQSIHSVWQVRFVAKSEVRRWPLIGWLSAHTGTLFIERGKRRHAARINQAIHAAFLEGDAIGVFPEGTTTEGTALRRFHASLLQPAVDEQALVYPVALRYLDPDGTVNVNASYVGETTLLESMALILGEKKIIAELIFLQAIDAVGKTRRDLARETQAAIAAALMLPDPGTTPEIPADPPGAPPTVAVPTDSRNPAPADSSPRAARAPTSDRR